MKYRIKFEDVILAWCISTYVILVVLLFVAIAP